MADHDANDAAGFLVEDFITSITTQLDRVQDALRIKAVNRPLTYALKELHLELKMFVDMDAHGQVLLRAAGPNEAGASTLAMDFTTITKPMIEENTISLGTTRSTPLDSLGLKPEEQMRLERLGVTNLAQLDRLKGSTGVGTVARLADVSVDRLRQALQMGRPRVGGVSPVPTRPPPAGTPPPRVITPPPRAGTAPPRPSTTTPPRPGTTPPRAGTTPPRPGTTPPPRVVTLPPRPSAPPRPPSGSPTPVRTAPRGPGLPVPVKTAPGRPSRPGLVPPPKARPARGAPSNDALRKRQPQQMEGESFAVEQAQDGELDLEPSTASTVLEVPPDSRSLTITGTNLQHEAYPPEVRLNGQALEIEELDHDRIVVRLPQDFEEGALEVALGEEDPHCFALVHPLAGEMAPSDASDPSDALDVSVSDAPGTSDAAGGPDDPWVPSAGAPP